MQKITLVGLNRIYKKDKSDEMVECYPYIRDFYCTIGWTYKILTGHKRKQAFYVDIYGIKDTLFKTDKTD